MQQQLNFYILNFANMKEKSQIDKENCLDNYEPIKKLAMNKLPERNPNKPFTSFSVRDILLLPEKKRNNETIGNCDKTLVDCQSQFSDSDDEDEIVVDDEPRLDCSKLVSPLDALYKMTSLTFEGLPDTSFRQGSHSPAKTKTAAAKRRRKSRTAFSNQQVYELEKRFLYQKYLTPADRDDIAKTLGLSNAQVITWFQNRRAKLKRDLEELKADVTAARVVRGENVPVHHVILEKVADSEFTKLPSVSR